MSWPTSQKPLGYEQMPLSAGPVPLPWFCPCPPGRHRGRVIDPQSLCQVLDVAASTDGRLLRAMADSLLLSLHQQVTVSPRCGAVIGVLWFDLNFKHGCFSEGGVARRARF